MKDFRGLFEAASKAGFTTDEPGNVMLLPKDKAAQDALRTSGFDGARLRPIHNSGHQGERRTAAEALQKLQTVLENEKAVPGTAKYNERAYQMLRGLEAQSRDDLIGTERVSALARNEVMA